jgi:hypothetical protein
MQKLPFWLKLMLWLLGLYLLLWALAEWLSDDLRLQLCELGL